MMSPGIADPSARQPELPLYEVRQSFWGYVIRGTQGPPILLQIAQGLVLALGAAALAASLAVAALTPGPVDGGFSVMRFGASTFLMGLALLCLRYATRGGVVELHVDLARGELREVVRHRVGRATTLGRLDFDPSASLHIQRGGPAGSPRALVLHHRGHPDGLCIARGPERALMALRVRLQHDMRIHAPAKLRREPASLVA